MSQLRGYWETLWRNADFLKLWAGETLSQVGTQITVLAMPLTGIIALGATPQQLGLLTAAGFAPVLLATLFAGVWLDNHRRRPVLLATNLGRAVLLTLVPLLYALDALTMATLYAIAFLTGLLTAVFDVAYLVYLPSLVPTRKLVEANAKLEATYSISQVVGPGLGGLLVQAVTAPVAILVDAASYLVGACTIAWIRSWEPPPEPRGQSGSTWAEIKDGFATTLRHPFLRPLMIQSCLFNLFQQVILTLYLLYGVRNLQLSPALLGAILATGSLGALAGTFVAPWASRTFGVGRILVGSMLLGSAALALVPAASGTKVISALILVTGFLVYELGLSVFNVLALSLRMAIIPAQALGRVTATYRFVVYGAIPLGALLAGFLGSAVGVRAAMVIAMVPLVTAALTFALTWIRTVRVLGEPAAWPDADESTSVPAGKPVGSTTKKEKVA